jgi:ABC-type glycerol-3-phosphate transport system substrate-binding protein
MGGLAYMVPSWSEHQAEAADFIRFATSRDVMQTFVKNTGQPARISALNDSTNVEFAPYFPTLSQSLTQGHPQVRIAESFQLLDFLGNEVALVLTGDKSIDQGLADIQAGFVDVLKEGGHLQ